MLDSFLFVPPTHFLNVPGHSHGQALPQGYLCGRICAGLE